MKKNIYGALLILVFILSYVIFQKQTPATEKVTLPKTGVFIDNFEVSQEKDAEFDILVKNMISGGPPKDGIPAVESPKYTTATEADKWLLPEDIIFGINYDGFVAAYPQRVLVWHEIANEKINGKDISIVYCPLTGSTLGFKGGFVKNISSTFGVSGKLVNSNVVIYDRATDSYWPQILATAISSPAKGVQLQEFPVVWTTWEKWKKKYPETKVLSKKTGFLRNYNKSGDPYGSYLDDDKGYYSSDKTLFKPINESDTLPPKFVVIGIRDAEQNAVAISKDKLRKDKIVEVMLGDNIVVVQYDENLDAHSAKIKKTGKWINSFDVMWFAWYAFYPDTELID